MDGGNGNEMSVGKAGEHIEGDAGVKTGWRGLGLRCCGSNRNIKLLVNDIRLNFLFHSHANCFSTSETNTRLIHAGFKAIGKWMKGPVISSTQPG